MTINARNVIPNNVKKKCNVGTNALNNKMVETSQLAHLPCSDNENCVNSSSDVTQYGAVAPCMCILLYLLARML